jgi:hypothetical protein
MRRAARSARRRRARCGDDARRTDPAHERAMEWERRWTGRGSPAQRSQRGGGGGGGELSRFLSGWSATWQSSGRPLLLPPVSIGQPSPAQLN